MDIGIPEDLGNLVQQWSAAPDSGWVRSLQRRRQDLERRMTQEISDMAASELESDFTVSPLSSFSTRAEQALQQVRQQTLENDLAEALRAQLFRPLEAGAERPPTAASIFTRTAAMPSGRASFMSASDPLRADVESMTSESASYISDYMSSDVRTAFDSISQDELRTVLEQAAIQGARGLRGFFPTIVGEIGEIGAALPEIAILGGSVVALIASLALSAAEVYRAAQDGQIKTPVAKAPWRLLGESCATGADCVSGVCFDGLCRRTDLTCANGYDCPSLICNSKIAAPGGRGTCEPIEKFRGELFTEILNTNGAEKANKQCAALGQAVCDNTIKESSNNCRAGEWTAIGVGDPTVLDAKPGGILYFQQTFQCQGRPEPDLGTAKDRAENEARDEARSKVRCPAEQPLIFPEAYRTTGKDISKGTTIKGDETVAFVVRTGPDGKTPLTCGGLSLDPVPLSAEKSDWLVSAQRHEDMVEMNLHGPLPVVLRDTPSDFPKVKDEKISGLDMFTCPSTWSTNNKTFHFETAVRQPEGNVQCVYRGDETQEPWVVVHVPVQAPEGTPAACVFGPRSEASMKDYPPYNFFGGWIGDSCVIPIAEMCRWSYAASDDQCPGPAMPDKTPNWSAPLADPKDKDMQRKLPCEEQLCTRNDWDPQGDPKGQTPLDLCVPKDFACESPTCIPWYKPASKDLPCCKGSSLCGNRAFMVDQCLPNIFNEHFCKD